MRKVRNISVTKNYNKYRNRHPEKQVVKVKRSNSHPERDDDYEFQRIRIELEVIKPGFDLESIYDNFAYFCQDAELIARKFPFSVGGYISDPTMSYDFYLSKYEQGEIRKMVGIDVVVREVNFNHNKEFRNADRWFELQRMRDKGMEREQDKSLFNFNVDGVVYESYDDVLNLVDIILRNLLFQSGWRHFKFPFTKPKVEKDTNDKTTAWMLRRDGMFFPVNAHLYVIDDDGDALESAFETAMFLYKYSLEDRFSARYFIILFVTYQLLALKSDGGEIGKMGKKKIRNLIAPYLKNLDYPVSPGEIAEICVGSDSFIHHMKDYQTLEDLTEIIDINMWIQKMKTALNQEFTRVRFGGKYFSFTNNREMYFRISSQGFDWMPVFKNFLSVMDRKLVIEKVTVIRDSRSDEDTMSPANEIYYQTKDGEDINGVSLETFINGV